MNIHDQANTIVKRYEYHLTTLMSAETVREQYTTIRKTAKDCAIFCATQAQKTTDIRGFNYWSDVIEAIENSL
jgi:hypothetical protein